MSGNIPATVQTGSTGNITPSVTWYLLRLHRGGVKSHLQVRRNQMWVQDVTGKSTKQIFATGVGHKPMVTSRHSSSWRFGHQSEHHSPTKQKDSWERSPQMLGPEPLNPTSHPYPFVFRRGPLQKWSEPPLKRTPYSQSLPPACLFLGLNRGVG